MKRATREIPEDDGLVEVDSRLLHLWEAKNSMQTRWKKNKLNRTLRLRIAQINIEIEEYANQLTKNQWEKVCDSMQGQLGLAKTWNLLRYLMDPDKSKSEQRKCLNKITHQYQGTNDELLTELKTRYIGTNAQIPRNHTLVRRILT